ncbi:hypothetical protein, partial [Roseateles koreensis]
MKRWQGLLVGALVATLSYALLPTSTVLTEKEMQKIEQLTTQMQTHCVGRYLIDLPQGFVLSSDTEATLFHGLGPDHEQLHLQSIKSEVSANDFSAWVAQGGVRYWPEEQETRAPKILSLHGVDALIKATAVVAPSPVFNVHYLGLRDGIQFAAVMVAIEGQSEIDRATTRLLDLSRRISRVSDPLKAGKGTCIDELLIAGQYDEEKLDIYFWHP